MTRENVIVVYHTDSAEPRMIVVDAQNPSDPAWNPAGHKQLHIDPVIYRSFENHESFNDYLREQIPRHRALQKTPK